ncbi:MAG: four-carbon acid sugar kinase family protein [Planctomycetota bacterium]|jgi:uncharacterized protein YgbK (DUF1537 family)
MIKILVVADDLTGANDTGVQFAKKGIPAFVTINMNVDIKSLDPQIAVLVVDTESRHISADKAADQIKRVVQHAKDFGIGHFYKKTDSTLRGNIGAELEAFMTAAGSDRLMFIPAYPKADRFTCDGYQYVGEELIHESVFGKDPLEPMDTSFVPSIIAKQSKIETVIVKPEAQHAQGVFQSGKKGIYVFDCRMDNDLAQIGKILGDNDALSVIAGPAGFAELLAGLHQLPQGEVDVCRNSHPLLIANGSVNETALKQADFACRNGFVDIALPPAVLFSSDSALCSEAKGLVQKAIDLSAKGKSVLVRTILQRNDLDNYIAQSGLSAGDSGENYLLAAKNMGQFTADVLKNSNFGNCVVFGGDTSIGVLKAIGCSGILLSDEIEAGLSVGRIVDFDRDINFITKSGGFGSEDIVLKIAGFLGKDV